ncbi:MAG: hypothetical protein ABGY95_01035 [Rubritalea sp.]|uniref:hypothetical protein n=1 Tax=Rubritalea sp. TaxID=2109375 RepID=UPI003242D7E7
MIAHKIQALISDAAAGDLASLLALVCFGGIYLCVTLALMTGLWKREGTAGRKAFWSLTLFIPVLGWLFYLAFYKVPESKAPC